VGKGGFFQDLSVIDIPYSHENTVLWIFPAFSVHSDLLPFDIATYFTMPGR